MDTFINIAKQGIESYSGSQSNVSKTGGQELNTPHGGSGYSTPPINQQEAIQNAQKQGSGESSLFSTALSFLSDNKSSHTEPLDEDSVTRAHEKVYKEGNTSGLSANLLGSAAALQVLKQFTSGGSSSSASTASSSSNSQTQLISLAMAEATKLFDKSSGTTSGGKQDAVNGAAMTIMKMLVQSKLGGAPTTGGKDSGGLSGLLSLASKFAK